MARVTTAEEHPRVAQRKRWQAIDWTMRAISLAIHESEVAGLTHVTEDLLRLHEVAARERDRA